MKKNYLVLGLFFLLFVIAHNVWLVKTFGDDSLVSVDDIVWSDSMFAELNKEQKDLLVEYCQNYNKIVEFYRDNVTMYATRKTKRYFDWKNTKNNEIDFFTEDREPIVEESGSWEYRSNTGKYFCAKETTESGINHIFLITPERNYLLDKRSLDTVHYSVAKESSSPIEDFIMPSLEDVAFSMIPFSNDGIALKYILFQKPPYASKHIIKDIVTKNSNGYNVVEVNLFTVGSKNKEILSHLVFLRDHFWVLLEYNTELPQDDTLRLIQNEYDQLERDKMPLLKSSVMTSTKLLDKTKRYRRYECDVTKIIAGPAPLSEFDVAQFLPPGSRVGIKTAYFSPIRILAIFVGFAFLIISILLKIKSQKNS
ncbi:MAG: hypothetical protein LBC74_16105 [Planctomycetaceae bacterium]|jgi:hypothetical protein|nr:hypothetical protein [Planctomycetaceae bacterium]